MKLEAVYAAVDSLLGYAKNCGLLDALDETFAARKNSSAARERNGNKKAQRASAFATGEDITSRVRRTAAAVHRKRIARDRHRRAERAEAIDRCQYILALRRAGYAALAAGKRRGYQKTMNMTFRRRRGNRTAQHRRSYLNLHFYRDLRRGSQWLRYTPQAPCRLSFLPRYRAHSLSA